MTPVPWDLVVAGGGAAGFFTALACAEHSPRALRILIVEKTHRPLGKVLISGGGRCNLTHACFDPARLVEFYPRGGKALRSAFARFQPRDTIAWFESHGVSTKTEADRRVFPVSDSARTVVDCLAQAAEQAGIEVWTQQTVSKLEQTGSGFSVHLCSSEGAEVQTVFTHNLLLATGGEAASLELAASLGHTIEPPVPSLFAFTINDPRLVRLAGISVSRVGLSLLEEDGNPLQLPGMRQDGDLLLTHTGISGPVVLRLSAWGARWLHERGYHAGLAINWIYPRGMEEALGDLKAYKSNPAHARRRPDQRALYRLPLRLWQRFLEVAGIPVTHNWADISKTAMQRLASELTQGRYLIQGKGVYKDEFVTCGGVCLDEVDFRTMQSKRLPGLYFAGEALDVDGLTGGFNFQNAWTTGWLAGLAIAQRVDEG